MFQNVESYFKQILPNLSTEAWKAFEKCLRVHQYKKGEIILLEGRVCNFISFINKGSVVVFDHVDGKKHIHNFFFENEFTADYESFLTREPAKYGLEAMENTVTFNMHYEDLQKIYLEYPCFERIGRLVAEEHFIRVVRHNASIMSVNPEDRYLKFVKDNSKIVQRVPQYHIASFLGVTPEALSRIRKRITTGERKYV